MKQEVRKKLVIAISMLIAFILWTIGICHIDVQPIGPQGTAVGFATVNQLIHNLTGVHLILYIITDWLGLIPICFTVTFAVLGISQWIKRKKIRKVDFSLWILGCFYITVIISFLLFENIIVNYRPILIDGNLEASYPSSTTLLSICVMYTAMLQMQTRIHNRKLNYWISHIIKIFIAFMVVGRLISGVHWFSDIIGGILLSIGLINAYQTVIVARSEESK